MTGCVFPDRSVTGLCYYGTTLFVAIYTSNKHCDAAHVEHNTEALREWLRSPSTLATVAVCMRAAEAMFAGPWHRQIGARDDDHHHD